MADIRTLKLALLADTKDFIQGLDKADKEAKTFSDKLGSALKAGAVAFAALTAATAAAAIKIGVDAVKAAIEDEKAQASLAQTLRNTTKATDAQIAATEEFIDKTARATGVADDQLRPSLQRLLVSTKDLTQAQKLQELALDISAGTGKDLLSVSDALAKASDGNFKALKNLGVELKTNVTTTKKLTVSKKDLAEAENKAEGASLRLQSAQERLAKATSKYGADSLQAQKAQNALEAAQISADKASSKYDKTLSNQGKTVKSTKEETISFDEAVRQLRENFAGQADIAANTFAGRMARLKVALDEAKETIGKALLPILEKLLGFITEKALPFLDNFVKGFENVTKSVNIDLGGALEYLRKIFAPILDGISKAFNTVRDALARNQEKLQPLYDLFKLMGLFVKDTLIPILAQGLGGAFQVVGSIIGGVIDFIANLVSAIDKGISKLQDFINKIQDAIDRAKRLPVIGSLIPDTLTSGKLIDPKSGKTIINQFNIKGAVDPQGTARQIVKITNTAAATTGLRAFSVL